MDSALPGAPPGARAVTQVAVGVLIRSDGAALLADRPSGKPYAGYWEFPGGKIEQGETVAHALARELAEELGVAVHDSVPWVVMEYDYPRAYVRLHFRRVFDWKGTPRAVEGQRLAFLEPGAEPPQPLLPAAIPAIRWILLPATTAFSPGNAVDAAVSVRWVEDLLDRGLRQLVWHEPHLAAGERDRARAALQDLARTRGARILHDTRGTEASQPPDLFLCADQLRTLRARPSTGWIGAGVRDRADLAHAAALGCDFAVLEWPLATPGAPHAGDSGKPEDEWDIVAHLCAAAPLPVYVPSASGIEALDRAQRLGAHGIAARFAA